MLLEKIQAIEEIMTEQLTSVKAVSSYKGEFEEGADWNPKFPAVLWALQGGKPNIISAGNTILNTSDFILLYIADKDTNTPKVLSTLESVIDLFDGASISFEVGTGQNKVTKYISTRIAEPGYSMHGYKNGVMVYTLMIEASA